MSSSKCRFCYSSTTKLSSSITDEIVKKFIEFVPEINITSDSQYPSSVCQLCYGKAKISFDFIQKILEVQQKFKGTRSLRKTQSNLKIVSTKSLSTSEALEKVQKVGTISIKKVSAINQTVERKHIKPEDLLDEIEELHNDDDEVYDIGGSSDEEFKVDKSESDDDLEFLEDDDDLSDDNYEPASKKKKAASNTSKSSASGSAKKKKAAALSKERNRSNVRSLAMDFFLCY